MKRTRRRKKFCEYPLVLASCVQSPHACSSAPNRKFTSSLTLTTTWPVAGAAHAAPTAAARHKSRIVGSPFAFFGMSAEKTTIDIFRQVYRSRWGPGAAAIGSAAERRLCGTERSKPASRKGLGRQARGGRGRGGDRDRRRSDRHRDDLAGIGR